MHDEVEHLSDVVEILVPVVGIVVAIGCEGDFLVTQEHQLDVVGVGLELPKSISVVLICLFRELVSDMEDGGLAQKPASLTAQLAVVVVELHDVVVVHFSLSFL